MGDKIDECMDMICLQIRGTEWTEGRKSILKVILNKYVGDLENKLLVTQEDNSELKDYCNTVWQLVVPLLPVCPDKTKRMLEKAMKRGKRLRTEGSHRNEILEEYKERMNGAMECLAISLPDFPHSKPISDDNLVIEAIEYIETLLRSLKDLLAICISRGSRLGLDDKGPVLERATQILKDRPE